MGIRIAEVGAGKRTVHSPVIIDAVYRPDIQQKKEIKCAQKKKEKQFFRMAVKQCGRRFF